jgi:glycosyltransferase involved in cell wall biosynthesis
MGYCDQSLSASVQYGAGCVKQFKVGQTQSKRLRVAFIHPFLFRYARGIERFTFNLANALTARGVDVHILTWRWMQPIRIDVLDPRVQIHLMPTSRYYAAKLVVPFYVRDLLTHGYDFVWVFFAGYGEAEAITLASWFRRLRFGINLHYPFAQLPHRYQELERYGLARRADVVVAVSAYVAEGAQQALGRECRIIANGVDANHFAPNPLARKRDRAALDLEDNVRTLLTVAALEERKGIQHVINALPMVLASHANVRYFVVGEGPYRGALETQIRECGLDASVKLLGATADILPLYNAADIFLLLARGEAMPIAPLEAMAMELPVIAASQPPFGEVVAPDCGILVPEKDSDQVATAINELLSNAPRRHAMGEAGRARVLADFTWERVAEQYQKAIE